MAQIDATKFDPYYKWLAIPPHEQPPNYYRLLGVELFEEDPDVIAAAADRQMGHVKSFAASRYASHSQRLLNELAEARICLLNAERKVGYDRQLKKELSRLEIVNERLLPPSSRESTLADPAGMIVPPSDAPSVVVEPRSPYGQPQQHRRPSGFGQGFIRVLFFLLALIPTIIIAWRIDLVNPKPQTVTVQQSEAPKDPPPRPAPPANQRPVRQAPVNQAPVNQAPVNQAPVNQAPFRQQQRRVEPRPDVREDEPNVRVDPIMPVEPREREAPKVERKPRPSQVVLVTFENKIQRAEITLEGNLCVQRVDGCPHEISPANGQLSQPVKITLTGPRPILLTVTVDNRRQLLIEPTIKDDDGRPMPCTRKQFESTLRRVIREGTAATNRVLAMQAERDRLQAWVDSPVLKALAARNEAIARIKLLDIDIAEGQKFVSILEQKAKGTNELLEWCKEYGRKCTLIIETL